MRSRDQSGERGQIGDFELDPGWHVYWVNAGDSGQPPRVTWVAPAGYEVGPLAWPQPTRIVPVGVFVETSCQVKPLRQSGTVNG